VAARCREASLAAKCAARATPGTEGPPEAVTIPPQVAPLTDEQWALVCHLLPPQRGPPHDRRELLGGILWVARTGSSWREMPEEFGKRERAYRRYELWLKQGLWQRTTLLMLLLGAALGQNIRPYRHPSAGVAGPIGAGPALARSTRLC
jgi:transposase